MSENERYQISKKVTIVGMFVNTLLAVIKMLIGLIGRSPALFADGVHSLSDLLSDIMVLFAAKHANKGADHDHPYGHERIETLATVILSLFLIIVGALIAYHSLMDWYLGQLGLPGQATVYAAILSILANEGLYRYTMIAANKVNSDLLRANAWHSRSDMWSSVVVLIGLIGTMFGLLWMDAAAAVIVAFMIIKMGVKWGYKSLSELIDTGVDIETLHQIEKVIKGVDGVKHYHCLRTRKMAGQILLDVHILVDAFITASEGHYIGEHVRGALAHEISHIKDITVHIDVTEHPEQFVDPQRMPPSRQQIDLQLKTFLQQKMDKVFDLHQITYLIYYHHREITLYFLLNSNDQYGNLSAALQEFSIQGIHKTTIKIFTCE
nr:cation diffusion facilitator family transporter [Facilibium subflavum]